MNSRKTYTRCCKDFITMGCNLRNQSANSSKRKWNFQGMLTLVKGQTYSRTYQEHPKCSTYYLKHCHEFAWKIQHEGACREINTAQGEAECCIYLETQTRVLYFSYTRAQAVL